MTCGEEENNAKERKNERRQKKTVKIFWFTIALKRILIHGQRTKRFYLDFACKEEEGKNGYVLNYELCNECERSKSNGKTATTKNDILRHVSNGLSSFSSSRLHVDIDL